MKKTIYETDIENEGGNLEFLVNDKGFLFMEIEYDKFNCYICLNQDSVENMIADLKKCLKEMKGFE